MIAFNFDYCRPDTLQEAADAYMQFQSEGKAAFYYAGGSEIITMSRTGSIQPEAVIDLKNIPECGGLALEAEALHIGAACTLNQISQSQRYPLLRLACGRIADHTNQCRITLGGNLCGTVIYRETCLPLLLADTQLRLFGPDGERDVSIHSVFDGRMRLRPGEFIVRVAVPEWALSARHFHIKKTANEKIDYPLISMSALCMGDQLRVGLSGVCGFPFRSEGMEHALSDRTRPMEARAALAMRLLPEPIRADTKGSGEYRAFVLQNTLLKLLEAWEHGDA